MPDAFHPGMRLIEQNDEIAIEGTLWMTAVYINGKPAQAQGRVNATRMEAVRPANRAKKVNHSWRPLNSQRDRAEGNIEGLLTELEQSRSDNFALRTDVEAAKAETRQVQQQASDSILNFMAGGDDD
jgi:hypothetical protein